MSIESRQRARAALRKLKKEGAEAAAAKDPRMRYVDGRPIGYADPNYQPRYRIRYQRPGEPEVDLYKAQEKQDLLHSCQAPNIWYGGAAGGGKSHSLRWHGYINCLRREGIKVLLLRRQFTELETTHILEIAKEIPAELGTYHGTLHRLTFTKTKSFIQFGHAHTLKAVRSYLSTAWDLILIDEGSEFTPQMLSLLQSRLRTRLAGIRPQMVIASNPGGEAHLWLAQRFIIKKVDPKEDPRYVPSEYAFIQSLVGDNQYNDEFYIDRLRSLSDADREAFLFGNMEAFAGQYFREWARSRHVRRPDEILEELEDWFEIEAGMDWGYSPSPGIVLWGAFDTFGRPTVYKELRFEESSPAAVAEQIVARCTTAAELRMTIHGDTQMWTKQPDTGVSIADEINDTFVKLGCAITLVQANKDRINGWARVHQFLDVRRPDPAGSGRAQPYLTIVDVDEDNPAIGAPYLISTIGAQVHSDKQDGDMKKQGNDHAVDALRYLLMAREPLSVLPRSLMPGKTHRERMRDKTRKLLAGAAAQLAQRKTAELEEEGLEVEDQPIEGLDTEGGDDEVIPIDGVEDLWN
jgi:phage terminase large subunit